MTVRTPCGHKPTAHAYRIGYLSDGSEWTLCGRRACDDAYNYGASQSRGAGARRCAFEVGAQNVGELGELPAIGVDAPNAPTQSTLF